MDSRESGNDGLAGMTVYGLGITGDSEDGYYYDDDNDGKRGGEERNH